MPLAVVLMRGVDNIPLVLAIAPAIVVIAAQLAASLAWITVSGEDAPELIATAPVLREHVEFGSRVAMQNSHAVTDDQLHPLREVPRWTWPGDDEG